MKLVRFSENDMFYPHLHLAVHLKLASLNGFCSLSNLYCCLYYNPIITTIGEALFVFSIAYAF